MHSLAAGLEAVAKESELRNLGGLQGSSPMASRWLARRPENDASCHKAPDRLCWWREWQVARRSKEIKEIKAQARLAQGQSLVRGWSALSRTQQGAALVGLKVGLASSCVRPGQNFMPNRA